jgi:hypothetical protein
MTATYAPPVDKLLTYGSLADEISAEWPDYLALGLSAEDIPELIRMATDASLMTEDTTIEEFSAPVHAFRALGQLHAEAASEPLLTLFDNFQDNDWIIEDLPQAYGMIGPAAIPALAAHVADQSKEEFSRTLASNGLVEIAKTHPEARSEVISTISKQLELFDEQEPELNGSLIADLGDLKAVETLPLIERAFNADAVDESIIDLEDVQVYFGLKEREPWPEPVLPPVSPLRQIISSAMQPGGDEDTVAEPVTAFARVHISHKSGASQKNKSKMAKQSRKKNRRKKK